MPSSAQRGRQRPAPADPAWRSRMIVPSRPDASSPGPSGPDLFSPTGGSCRSAARLNADIWLSCHWISSATACGPSGAASPAALAACAAAPSACAPMWGMAAACPAALAAATAGGAATSRAAAPPRKRRRISSETSSSPRAKARVRAMASRGRLSPGASASNNHSTRCAQPAAHPATIRLSASLSVCAEPTPSDSPRPLPRVRGIVQCSGCVSASTACRRGAAPSKTIVPSTSSA